MVDKDFSIYCPNCNQDPGIVFIPEQSLVDDKDRDYCTLFRQNRLLEEHHKVRRCCIFGLYNEDDPQNALILILYGYLYKIRHGNLDEFLTHY